MIFFIEISRANSEAGVSWEVPTAVLHKRRNDLGNQVSVSLSPRNEVSSQKHDPMIIEI